MTSSAPRSRLDPARFLEAQAPVYETVLAELRGGAKTSHWMWFIFPQLAGLGRSSTARYYGLEGLPEATVYLAHEVLGARLSECTRIVLDLPPGTTALAVFGSIDSMKFRSSMTLFELTSGAESPFSAALDRYFEGNRDEMTRSMLGVT